MHVRRAKKTYPGTSMELNADLGGAILDAFPEMKVDVHNPQLLITVEIREKIYIYSESIPGPGGMPIGTNGKAMLLLSGGIDSPVAGYMIAKRGVKIDAVYFHAPLSCHQFCQIHNFLFCTFAGIWRCMEINSVNLYATFCDHISG